MNFIYSSMEKSKKFSFFTHNIQYNDLPPLICYSFQEYIKNGWRNVFVSPAVCGLPYKANDPSEVTIHGLPHS